MKKIIRKLLPPIILDIIRKLRTSNVPQLTSNGFKSWWSNYSSMNSQTLPKDLLNMINYYINTEIFNATSGYWRYLCKQHIELLVDDGVGNFKQTIEKNHYWGEATLSSRLISPIMSNKVFVNVLTSEIFKVHSHCSMQESVQHNLSNIILLNYLVENGLGKYLEYMEEPLFGNPITLLYKERRISFSLLNSIIELDTILEYIKPKPGHRFLELGAGSGRTCIALLKTLGDVKYIIADIPPALFISQENISRELPNKTIFKFREFLSFDEVEELFISSDIAFISPEQLELIPDSFVDTSIAIDCLHEMNNESVEEYFNQFDRISDYIYFKSQMKQWAKTSRRPLDYDTYPIKGHWKEILHEKCVIPNDYFNAIYKM